MAASLACLCRQVTQEIQLDATTDHSHLQLCHCSNCRAITGLLAAAYYLIQHEPTSLDGLHIYEESSVSSESPHPHVSRFFCGTCGAHVFARVEGGQGQNKDGITPSSSRYLVAAGVLVESDTPPVDKITHWQVKQTRDGGLSCFLPRWPSTETPYPCVLQADFEVFSTGCPSTGSKSPDELELELELAGARQTASASASAGTSLDPSDHLHAKCHCGGINFYITRPDESSSLAHSPWADLLVPYHTGPTSSENPSDVKWWLRNTSTGTGTGSGTGTGTGSGTGTGTGTKYLAGTCACTSCRLASGFPIQVWAFIPRSNIFNADGSSLVYDTGTMRRYQSSEGVYREFCGRCGASVFWHNEGRPMLVDVSVGLLRGNGDGARVEGWLEWETGRVSFAEMAVQKDLVGFLEDGLREYEVTRS